MTWLRLDQSDGPQCPNCGCRDTKVEENTVGATWFGGRQLSPPPVPLPPKYAAMGMAVCQHCRRRFAVRAVEIQPQEPSHPPEEISDTGLVVPKKKVPLPRLECPDCNSTNVIVRKTERARPPHTRTWRQHTCRACGFTFQSFEEVRSPKTSISD